MPFGLQPWHIIVILIVALIIFGPSRLPELGKNLGKAIMEFRRGTRELTESFKTEITKDEEQQKPAVSENSSVPVQASPPSQTIMQPPISAASQSSPAKESIGSTSTTEKICPSCGTVNNSEARFCNHCGAQLIS